MLICSKPRGYKTGAKQWAETEGRGQTEVGDLVDRGEEVEGDKMNH